MTWGDEEIGTHRGGEEHRNGNYSSLLLPYRIAPNFLVGPGELEPGLLDGPCLAGQRLLVILVVAVEI